MPDIYFPGLGWGADVGADTSREVEEGPAGWNANLSMGANSGPGALFPSQPYTGRSSEAGHLLSKRTKQPKSPAFLIGKTKQNRSKCNN